MNIFTSCQKQTKYDKEVKVEYIPAHFSLNLPITDPERIYEMYLDDERIPSLHEEMMKMRNLRKLALSDMLVDDWKKSEKIINSFDKLKTLILDENHFKSLPFDPGKLESLKYLDISYNDKFNVQENLYKLSQCNNLEELVVSGLQMKTFPDEILNLKNLKTLAFGDYEDFNYQKGFELLSKHSNLEYIDVGYANLNPLPKSFAKLKLKKLGIYDCNIDLNELLNVTKNWSNLEQLALGDIHLKVLPETIKDHKNITTIWLFDNRHLNHKKVFKQLSHLPGLEELDISNTIRQEQHKRFVMPEELAGLKNLKRLDLVTSHNLVFDSLFDVLVRLPKLEQLNLKNSKAYVDDNFNYKVLPASIKELQNLKELNLENTSYDILKNVDELPELEKLNWSDCGMGKIPDVIFKTTSLKSLNLNDDKLKNLPEEIGNLKNLVHLDLGNNQLKDLPESITKLKKLRYLNLMGTHIAESKEKRKEIEQMLPNTLIFFGEYEAYEPI
jgi:Leucine-rich repeat (LRR) protein